MSITERAQSMISQLPDSEVQKIGNHFEDVLREQNCVITDRYGTRVDWEMNPNHKDLLKILKKTRGRGATIESIEELTIKEQRMYEKRKRVLSDRYKNKAQRRYFMSVARGKNS